MWTDLGMINGQPALRPEPQLPHKVLKLKVFYLAVGFQMFTSKI